MSLSWHRLLQGALLTGAIALLPADRTASTVDLPLLSGVPPEAEEIVGTIVGRGEADENEWQLETPDGVVIVDAGDRDRQVIDLELGEAVIITGEFDEGEFDAFTITRADGTIIEVLAATD